MLISEELEDITRYGSKELFVDENDEAMKSRQIQYHDAAIDRKHSAVLDPLKRHKDGKKLFQFNRVFGPTGTQEEVFCRQEKKAKHSANGAHDSLLVHNP
ncbi:unnamed protein product [Lactuca virosa]|uniref:Uncharacterized protein n=1 Tax=Lactuca virosa TaxID=75947 RepID=A0AAU9MD51_9ASTR|nr:unnamed protein product [Lactuca virosa]